MEIPSDQIASTGLSGERRWRFEGIVWATLVVGAAALRLWCTTRPPTTGDIFRSALTGQLVLDHGLGALAWPLNRVYGPMAVAVPWMETPYNYPALAALFWTAVAWVHASIFGIRVFFTALEAVNAWLVFRLTGSRWWAAAYWCFPCSIYWASHEAEFEPLEVLFMLGALVAIGRRWPTVAGVAVSAGVQVKLMAALFVPYLIHRAWVSGRQRFVALLLIGVIAGMLPTAWLSLHYPIVDQVLINFTWLPTSNSYHWAFWSHTYPWVPASLQFVMQVASYVMLAIVVLCARGRLRDVVAAVPILGLLIAAKVMTAYMWWYFMLLIPCLVPIAPKLATRRRMLIAVVVSTLALEPVSSIRLSGVRRWGSGGVPIDVYVPVVQALTGGSGKP